MSVSVDDRSYSWLITGSSRGLGREMAVAALRRGDRVTATARDTASLQELVDEFGERVLVHQLDVTQDGAAEGAVAAACEAFGALDVVVSNAAYANNAAIEDMEEVEFRAQMETNFFGAVRLVRASLPRLRGQGHGHLVMISSITGRFGGTPGLSAYYASKFALEGFTEVLATEVVPLGLKVTLVEPGAFRTDFIVDSTHLSPSEAYAETVGARQAIRKQVARDFPGNPALAGERVVDIVRMDPPPFRLLLGSDAVAGARADGLARLREIEQWEHISCSTDYVVE